MAAAKKTTEKEVETTEVKTRSDFKSWKEYNDYKGPKA